MTKVTTLPVEPKPGKPTQLPAETAAPVERACVVCGMGSHRTDWIQVSPGGDMVACDFHTQEEIDAAVKGALAGAVGGAGGSGEGGTEGEKPPHVSTGPVPPATQPGGAPPVEPTHPIVPPAVTPPAEPDQGLPSKPSAEHPIATPPATPRRR